MERVYCERIFSSDRANSAESGAASWGVFLWLLSFAQAKKVTYKNNKLENYLF